MTSARYVKQAVAMTTLVAAVLVIAASSAAGRLPSASASVAVRVHHCRGVGPLANGTGVSNITAQGVSCAVARRIFRRMLADGEKVPKGWHVIRGYSGSLARGHRHIYGAFYNAR